jgi:drug/metabolite transporter (DMT)-like permease
MRTAQKTYLSFPGPQTSRTKAFLALLFISVSWGTTWVASRHAVRLMPVFQLAGIRQMLAGMLFLVYFLGKKSSLPAGREWLSILVLSFLNLFLTNGLTTWGVKFIPAGLGAIIAAIFPLWLLLLGLLRKPRPSLPPKALLGLVLGFGGVCVIFYEHLGDFFQADFRFGIFISLLASLSWALGTLYTKKQATQFNPYFSIGLQMVISGTAFYLISLGSKQSLPLMQIPAAAWVDLIYLVVVGSCLSFLAFLYALQHLPTEQVSIYAYLNPVVAVLLGAWLFAEKLTVFIGLGGLIALYGVYLVNESYQNRSMKP